MYISRFKNYCDETGAYYCEECQCEEALKFRDLEHHVGNLLDSLFGGFEVDSFGVDVCVFEINRILGTKYEQRYDVIRGPLFPYYEVTNESVEDLK